MDSEHPAIVGQISRLFVRRGICKIRLLVLRVCKAAAGDKVEADLAEAKQDVADRQSEHGCHHDARVHCHNGEHEHVCEEDPQHLGEHQADSHSNLELARMLYLKGVFRLQPV